MDSADTAPRRSMIDNQLRPNGVNDPRLLKAIASVDRSRFALQDDVALAYGDRAIALSGGRAVNPALTTARLILDLAVQPDQHILLVGAATGYAAALLSALDARVTALECDPNLAERARALLSGDARITVMEGALAEGVPAAAPFDAILVDGAVEQWPAALTAQLVPGGRIATGVVEQGVPRLARAVRVVDQHAVQLIAFADLECVGLPGFAPPPRFRF